MMSKIAVSVISVFALGAQVLANKETSCPEPFPSLGTIQDASISADSFTKSWPSQLEGTWYLVAVANQFAAPDQTCGRYEYTVNKGWTSTDTVGTYTVKSGSGWQKFNLKGFPASTPGDYREAHPEAKMEELWKEIVAHFGDTADGSNTLWVRWGCTSPPLDEIQYTAVLARKVPVTPEALEEALKHLKSIDAQNIDNIIPHSHEGCVYPAKDEL